MFWKLVKEKTSQSDSSIAYFVKGWYTDAVCINLWNKFFNPVSSLIEVLLKCIKGFSFGKKIHDQTSNATREKFQKGPMGKENYAIETGENNLLTEFYSPVFSDERNEVNVRFNVKEQTKHPKTHENKRNNLCSSK